MSSIPTKRLQKTNSVYVYIPIILYMKTGQTIYLDHQATTPVDSVVLDEMSPYYRETFGNPHSVDHSVGWRASKAVDSAAQRVGQLFGADADEIFFTSGATEANNLALLGIGRKNATGKRNRILVSSIEHKCVLASSRVLREQHGYVVEELPVDSNGFVDLQALEDNAAEDVLLVSIMAVNNEVGTIQDIASISEIVRSKGIVFHCDAAQAPCALNLDGFSDHVDLLSLSGHKIYGPKGIGVLFVRRQTQRHVEPMIYGGGQQQDLRSGTLPVALCVGMGSAAVLCSGENAERELASLRKQTEGFVNGLEDLKWPISVNGPPIDMRHPGNANVRFKGFDAKDILGSLQPRVAASTGSACTSGIEEPSHVLNSLGLTKEEAEESIRFSLGRYTTQQDLEEAVALIAQALNSLEEGTN